jgi:hypothetical protein
MAARAGSACSRIASGDYRLLASDHAAALSFLSAPGATMRNASSGMRANSRREMSREFPKPDTPRATRRN